MSRDRAAGFTLVELLVALAIFGLMSVLLSGGLHSLSRVVSGGNDRLDRTAQLTLTANFLDRVLADARPLPDPSGTGILFDGTDSALHFIGAPPATLANGGFHRLQLDVEAKGTARQLVLRSQALNDARKPSRSILLDGIAGAPLCLFWPNGPGRTARLARPMVGGVGTAGAGPLASEFSRRDQRAGPGRRSPSGRIRVRIG